MVMRALAAWLLLFGFFATLHAAEFRATTDRHQLASDEHLLLTLALENSDTRLRAVGINPNVDLSVLTSNFDVGTPRENHRYNIYRGRGRSTSDIVVELFPKQPGTFTIPAFRVDDLSTAPISITVTSSKENSSPRVFLRHGTSSGQAWQYGALSVWLDIYHRVELREAKLGGDLELEPTPLDALENQRLPVATRHETMNGFDYEVMRTTWNIYPTEAGLLKCYFPDVWIVSANGEQLRLPRHQTEITIAARPPGVDANLLTGTPQLNVDIAQSTDQAGAPAVLRATLRSSSRRLSIPSELLMRAAPGLQIYAGAPRITTSETTQGVEHTAVYTYTVIAPTIGTWAMPEFGVQYFDPERAQLATITATAPALNITQAINTTLNAPTPANVEITPGVLDADSFNPWPIATLAMTILWISTLVVAGYWRRKPTVTTVSPSPKSLIHGHAARPLEVKLLEALQATSLDEGLSQYERRYGPDPEVRALVHAVQALYYDRQNIESKPKVNISHLDAIVHKIIVRRASLPQRDDPWSPLHLLEKR